MSNFTKTTSGKKGHLLLGEPPQMTSCLPPDPQSYSYTMMGARLFNSGNQPLYCRDVIRTRPSLVVGSTGTGKTELLLNIAFQDIWKGRCTVFIDGKCDEETRNKLFYYAHVVSKRPFYMLLPYASGAHLTSSWNPFISSSLTVDVVSSMFISPYADYGGPSNGGSDYYIAEQRDVFASLMKALKSSGYSYNPQDVRHLLENSDQLHCLIKVLRQEGLRDYGHIMRKVGANGKVFTDNMRGFVNHLKLFTHWSLNSYNPSIQLDKILETDAVIYIGLPVDSEGYLMKSIGNIMVNQLKGISAYYQSMPRNIRPSISCIVDEAGAFVDEGLADWMCRVRSSGFMLMLGIQTLADLEGRKAGFSKKILGNAPNVMMFNPRDSETAKWFSELSGVELKKVATANIIESVEDDKGSMRQSEVPRIHKDSIMKLRVGQFFYRSAEPTDRPVLLASPLMPVPKTERAEYQCRKVEPQTLPVLRGLNFGLQAKEMYRQITPNV